VSENADDLGEAMRLKDVEELERFLRCESTRVSNMICLYYFRGAVYHFKAKTTVDHEQDEVCDFRYVDH